MGKIQVRTNNVTRYYCSHCEQQVTKLAFTCPSCGNNVTEVTKTVEINEKDAAADGRPMFSEPSYISYAGFWKRFVAYFIDGIIIVVGSFLFGGVLGISGMVDPLLTKEAAGGANIIFNLMGIVIAWLYYATWESSSYQATPGKLALDLRVTDTGHKPITFIKATGRHFGKILSALILCIGYMMAGFTSKKQGLHDMMAGTLVISDA